MNRKDSDDNGVELGLILLSWMVTISLGAMMWARWLDPIADDYTKVALTALWGIVVLMAIIATARFVSLIRARRRRRHDRLNFPH